MAGIYIHIPFCKQACHYCNFHFTTSLRRKNELISALLKEMTLQKDYLRAETIETIYIGGGTPSLLDPEETSLIIDTVSSVFDVAKDAELTLEANPDDISEEKLVKWRSAGINRLSIGIQSFSASELVWMNRAHDERQALNSLELAKKYFTNITADLIYGTPGLNNDLWRKQVDKMLELDIPHLSCYALTVEPNTVLHKLIATRKKTGVDSDRQADQFLLLMNWLDEAGFEHYEISNFAKPGFRSRHNSSYWQGKKYLGIGPSAHSYDGDSRQWNTPNNLRYLESIEKGVIPFEKESLSATQKINEYIMTALRTVEGIDLRKLDAPLRMNLEKAAAAYADKGLLHIAMNERISLTREGKLQADGIASALFFD